MNCINCGGLIAEPDENYCYSGKVCRCAQNVRPIRDYDIAEIHGYIEGQDLKIRNLEREVERMKGQISKIQKLLRKMDCGCAGEIYEGMEYNKGARPCYRCEALQEIEGK